MPFSTYCKEHLRSNFLNDFRELLKLDLFSVDEDLLDQSVDLFLGLDSVKEYITKEG